MSEAVHTQMPKQLRELFVTILTECRPANPSGLWETFKQDLCEDFLHQERLRLGRPNLPLSGPIEDRGLRIIDDLLHAKGFNLAAFHIREPAPEEHDLNALPRIVRQQLAFNTHELAADVAARETSLTEDQRTVYQAIVADTLAAIEQQSANQHQPPAGGRVHFVYSPGGCGKTFLFNLILDKVRSMDKVALATGSSGIASLLLNYGK